jgi:hypothetical protein
MRELARRREAEGAQGGFWLTIDERVRCQTALKFLELPKIGGRRPGALQESHDLLCDHVGRR